MDIERLFIERFEHDYVWVNRGEWRSASSTAAAVDATLGAASLASWSHLSYIKRIIIEIVECPDNHVDMWCDHLKVTLEAWT